MTKRSAIYDQEAWPSDHIIQDIGAAGLRQPCRVRLKIFTLDSRLILRKLGSLGPTDRKAVAEQLRTCIVGFS